jgi:hypothetical protein
VKVRSLCSLATALGVWAGAAPAAEPAKLPTKPAAAKPSANQPLAEAIHARLTRNGYPDGADLTISTLDGVVTVTGTCRDAAQKAAIIQEVRVVPGVKLVKDGLTAGTVRQAQGTTVQPGTVPMGPVATMPPVGVPPGAVGPVIEPAPLGHPGAGPADGFAPPLPPYAWPTYAPYNNVSRVAYPNAYPYNAFPFIGPFYPFPKVPLGWRSVTLQWEDGHWWLGRTSAPHDYWRVRFW